MVELGVSFFGHFVQRTVRQKSTVLATAIVMTLVHHKTIRQRFVIETETIRHMATTAQLLISVAPFFQNGRDLLNVHVFTIVAGTHQGQFFGS